MLDVVKTKTMSSLDADLSLRQRWDEFRRQNPKVRIREAARQLGVTELELVALGSGEGNVRLTPGLVVLDQGS